MDGKNRERQLHFFFGSQVASCATCFPGRAIGAFIVFRFDPQAYGVVAAQLIDPDRLCELGPGSENRSVADQLKSIDVDTLFPGKPVTDRDMVRGCLSGIWLLHDFLHESHTISQDISSSSGSYWHGIMHRREPDYSNSKHWFRRVGRHEIFEPLCAGTQKLAAASSNSSSDSLKLQSSWNPFAFIDLCESVVPNSADSEDLLRRVARLEWQLLFDHCYRYGVEDITNL